LRPVSLKPLVIFRKRVFPELFLSCPEFDFLVSIVLRPFSDFSIDFSPLEKSFSFFVIFGESPDDFSVDLSLLEKTLSLAFGEEISADDFSIDFSLLEKIFSFFVIFGESDDFSVDFSLLEKTLSLGFWGSISGSWRSIRDLLTFQFFFHPH